WRRTDDLRQTDISSVRRRNELQEGYENASRQAHERFKHELADIKTRYDDERQGLQDRWEQGTAQARAASAAMNAECARLFPGWDDSAWNGWNPPRTFPPEIRFGEFRVSLGARLNGEANRQTIPATALAGLTLPALLPFPGGSILIQASDNGRSRGVELLQTVMFRVLSSLPPGKVRFTILDPVGLGQNFAAFMHLADYDEALVGGRIWTEQSH